jgi:hypothetical protein
MEGPPPLPKAMLSRSATTVTKPVIPAKAWKKIEAESGVGLSKLKKPVAIISQHVQLKVCFFRKTWVISMLSWIFTGSAAS